MLIEHWFHLKHPSSCMICMETILRFQSKQMHSLDELRDDIPHIIPRRRWELRWAMTIRRWWFPHIRMRGNDESSGCHFKPTANESPMQDHCKISIWENYLTVSMGRVSAKRHHMGNEANLYCCSHENSDNIHIPHKSCGGKCTNFVFWVMGFHTVYDNPLNTEMKGIDYWLIPA